MAKGDSASSDVVLPVAGQSRNFGVRRTWSNKLTWKKRGITVIGQKSGNEETHWKTQKSELIGTGLPQIATNTRTGCGQMATATDSGCVSRGLGVRVSEKMEMGIIQHYQRNKGRGDIILASETSKLESKPESRCDGAPQLARRAPVFNVSAMQRLDRCPQSRTHIEREETLDGAYHDMGQRFGPSRLLRRPTHAAPVRAKSIKNRRHMTPIEEASKRSFAVLAFPGVASSPLVIPPLPVGKTFDGLRPPARGGMMGVGWNPPDPGPRSRRRGTVHFDLDNARLASYCPFAVLMCRRWLSQKTRGHGEEPARLRELELAYYLLAALL
ncbi:hypothetical protein H4582DRAFT_2059955 [Lactarius indigo]|nr:hypothetical protein H4582DRAFT_2059955 [Lactarius indigo]